MSPFATALLLDFNPLTPFADDCRLVADARERRLHTTVSQTCVVTQTYSTFGDRAFSAAGPGLWNNLPSHMKDADLSYNEFPAVVKDISAWTVGPWCSVNFVNCADWKYSYLLTYLLTYLLYIYCADV